MFTSSVRFDPFLACGPWLETGPVVDHWRISEFLSTAGHLHCYNWGHISCCHFTFVVLSQHFCQSSEVSTAFMSYIQSILWSTTTYLLQSIPLELYPSCFSVFWTLNSDSTSTVYLLMLDTYGKLFHSGHLFFLSDQLRILSSSWNSPQGLIYASGPVAPKADVALWPCPVWRQHPVQRRGPEVREDPSNLKEIPGWYCLDRILDSNELMQQFVCWWFGDLSLWRFCMLWELWVKLGGLWFFWDGNAVMLAPWISLDVYNTKQ